MPVEPTLNLAKVRFHLRAQLVEAEGRVTVAIADLKEAVSKLETKMDAGFAGMRAEMNTQFRWIMGGIGSAALVILGAVIAAILTKG